MNMFLWLTKVAVFFSSAYICARLMVKFFLKRNHRASVSDPEIIAVAVIIGAFVTGIVMFFAKRII
jgi:hypothetical protein